MSCLISVRTLIVLLTAATLVPAAAFAQTTWYVDDDAPDDPGPGDPNISDPLEDGSRDHPFDAIREGIDAASDGDTVLVRDGTYTGDGNRDLVLGGKVITVRSENGPQYCIIDCEHDGRGFFFHSGEGGAPVVEGFTVTNGYGADRGGGILCFGGSPTIRDCVVEYNSAWAGGGLHCEMGSPSFIRCRIHGNTALGTDWGEGGGGVHCRNGCTATFSDCTISDNEAIWDGGGVLCLYEGLTCVVSLSDCRIVGNASAGGGGGVCSWVYPVRLFNCAIVGNSAAGGGGVHLYWGEGLIANCLIAGNTANLGAGLSICDSSLEMTEIANCTFTANIATHRGGAIYHSDYESWPIPVVNCLLWGDTPTEIDWDYDPPVVMFSDVQGGWPGEGNIAGDPLFVDSDGPDDDPNTFEDNDYRLSGGSACIDAASNGAVPPDTLDLDGDGNTDEPIPFDLDGNPRFVDDAGMPDSGSGAPPIVDMGAYEFQGETCFGDLDGDDDVDLSDWRDYSPTLAPPVAPCIPTATWIATRTWTWLTSRRCWLFMARRAGEAGFRVQGSGFRAPGTERPLGGAASTDRAAPSRHAGRRGRL